jgi:hypothetical protein
MPIINNTVMYTKNFIEGNYRNLKNKKGGQGITQAVEAPA